VVAVIAVFRFSRTKPTYLYVEIKMGQGLWWAQTAKPSIWFIKALQPGEKEIDLFGKTTAELLAVRYYPYESNQYNIFIYAKIRGSYNKKTNKFLFKNLPIATGAPIELDFPKAQISGSIIDINKQPSNDKSDYKIVYLTKKFANPWEYQAIKVGDRYFDGVENVFEVINKETTDTSIITPDSFGNMTSETVEPRNYIIIKGRMKLKYKYGQLIYGEDQPVKIYSRLNLFTERMELTDFLISAIE